METTNKNPEKESSKIGSLIEDSAITAAVKAKLLADPYIKGLNIHVTTVDGVVTLSGVVPTAEMKKKAVAKAHKTKGVYEVDSKIRVRS